MHKTFFLLKNTCFHENYIMKQIISLFENFETLSFSKAIV